MRIELDHGLDRQHGFLTVAESIDALLGSTPLLSMATVSEEGTPWLHNAYFAYDADLHLYCLTRPESRHVRNLAHSGGRVSVTVADTRQEGTPGTRQGVQLQGHCAPAAGGRLAHGAEVFGRRFPAFAAAAHAAARPGASDTPLQLHVVTVDTLTLFDERVFGLENWISGRVRRDADVAA